MTEQVLRDEEARQAVVGELDTCFLVEAGAGSGKTYSMVRRMAALVREGKCRVEEMAAVTFTRKAAAELKERFQLVLEKKLAQETDPEKKKRLEEALCSLDRSFLGTIHSFCAALLKERSIEAGLDPDFREMDEAEDALLQEKAWEDYLNGVLSISPHLLENLLKIDIDAGELKDCFKTLLAYPDVMVVCEDTDPPDLEEARARLNEFLDEVKEFIPAAVPAKGWDPLQQVLRDALQRREFLGFSDDLTLLRLLAGLDKKAKITQNRWECREDALNALDLFETFRGKYIVPVLQAWYEYRHSRILEFIRPAIKLYEQRKKEQSKLNYQDLLMYTAALLRENPEVRQYFQKRYSHFLVDEFQDTDPIQAEIMFYLTGTDVAEKNWQKLVPKPGSLFVVGDPKQSIYRFRRADIDTYNLVKRLLTESGGKVLYFTTNFRSVKGVGDFVNSVFGSFFPEKATASQAAFKAMDTLHCNEEGKSCGVRKLIIPKVKRDKQADIAGADARKIAEWIRWALNGGISLSRTEEELKSGLTERPVPADFMIILRYKAYMEKYARELERCGIPFQIAGGNGFAQSGEINELLKVLRAVLEPDNPVRLAAALRGIYYGISDRKLWLFKQAGGSFNFLAGVPGALCSSDRELFEWAFGQLKLFLNWIHKLPASAALENIIREIGAVPYAFSGELGRSRSGYLMQCIELIAAEERRGTTSFSDLVEYLELLVEKGVEEEINVAPWEGDAVRLMNLHKAKGLEAPVVFLANPGKNTKISPRVHINRVGDMPCGYFVFEKKENHKGEILGQPLYWINYEAVEQEYLEAEDLRLLYVAATRAKNLLVISSYPAKPEKSPWYRLNGFLENVDELENTGIVQIGEGEQEAQSKSEAGGGNAGGVDAVGLLEELTAAKKTFLNRESPLNSPSYHTAAVTELTKGGRIQPVRAETGRGMSWGRIVHRVLEVCAKRLPSNLELLVENIMAEEGRALEEKKEILGLVDSILRSPLWQRMLKSSRRFTEVPFSIKVDGKKYGFNYKGETIVSGVIDLVFREGTEWVLVDYKTDTIKDERMFKELVDYYSPQVRMYKKYWEDLTGEKVCEAGLYFTYVDRWIVVPEQE